MSHEFDSDYNYLLLSLVTSDYVPMPASMQYIDPELYEAVYDLPRYVTPTQPFVSSLLSQFWKVSQDDLRKFEESH